MKPEEIEAIAHACAKHLQQSNAISEAEHLEHHRWISVRIRAEEERQKFWEDMRVHVSKWGMISLLSGLFFALWLGARQIFRAMT